ncbi:MAG: SUMF1/EgtB/PvdO family nonheme iron enzyme, partial [bacterium]
KAGQGGNQWSNLGDDGHVYTAPVGSYKSSASWCGAFDMAGNAYEWVQDVYAPYPPGPRVDPLGPASGERRVRRGGSFDVEFYFGLCAKRGEHPPHDRRRDEGFRVVMDF